MSKPSIIISNEDTDIRLWCDRCKGALDPETAPMICLKCYNELVEKAEAYDLIHPMTVKEYYQVFKDASKLEAVKKAFRKHYGVGLPDDFHASDYDACDAYYLADDIKKILEASA